jgi:hypothetical protein
MSWLFCRPLRWVGLVTEIQFILSARLRSAL